MSTAQVQILSVAFSGALESLAFITSLPPEAPPVAPANAMLVRIAMTGTDSSVLELVAGREFGRLLSANLLGLSSDDPEIDQRCNDALKELINVTAGAFIGMAIEQGVAPQEIGIPVIEPFTAEIDWEDFAAAPGASVLDAEGHIIAIRVREAA